MDRLFREVLANADVRNANAGTGITITGTPDDVATISASQDIEDLIDAGILTATDSGTADARQLVAGADGTIVITDNGGGSTLEISVGEIQITNLGPVADLSVLGVPTADDGFDFITTINSSDNDTLLRRTSDTLNWGQLTAGMFPDSMVTILSGTEFEIETDQVDLHAQLRVQIATGVTGIVIDGDIGDATTPIIDVMNVGDQKDRRFLYFRETTGNGFFIDLMLAETFGNNSIVFGSEYSAPGDTPRMMELWADGRVSLANDVFEFDPDDGENPSLEISGTASVRLLLTADTDNVTETHTPAIIFSQDGNTTVATVGLSGNANTDAAGVSFIGAPANSFSFHGSQGSPSLSFGGGGEVALLIDSSNDVGVRAGNVFRVYDPTNADSYNFSHNGTNALLTFTTTTAWDISGAAEIEITGGMDLWIRDAGFLRIYDSGDTDYGQFSHDGTNFVLAHVNTTAFRIEDVNVVIPDGYVETINGDEEDGIIARGATGFFNCYGYHGAALGSLFQSRNAANSAYMPLMFLSTTARFGRPGTSNQSAFFTTSDADDIETVSSWDERFVVISPNATPGGQQPGLGFGYDSTNDIAVMFALEPAAAWHDLLVRAADISIWSTSGNLALVGTIDNDQGVALGGGSAATLGTIGGSGPTSAGQAQWLKIKISGTDHWIPAWT